MDLFTLLTEKGFIGSEFLTWLWFRSETGDGIFTLPATPRHPEEKVEVWFDDRLTLRAERGQSLENILKGGSPSISKEAKTALMEGKKVVGAKIRILRGTLDWTFTIKAETLDIHALKLPEIDHEDEETAFFDRIDLVEQLETLIERLFDDFLHLRLSPRWREEELPAMRRWVFASLPSDPFAEEADRVFVLEDTEP
ncbi:MAG: hypothetical protein D6795_04295 [Deltaproteobacteria bacterium]|nr:MAG: hypothetical protein D6795_04295 [Deltaproteobacteria bacterium]